MEIGTPESRKNSTIPTQYCVGNWKEEIFLSESNTQNVIHHT